MDTHGGQPRACDEYGHHIGVACLPGNDDKIAHDALLSELYDLLRTLAHSHAELEVRSLFAHLLPNNFDFDNPQSKNIILDMWYDAALPARDTSRRPGRANLRPLERWMFELKTIHAGC